MPARLVSEANDEVNRMRQEIDLEISRKRKDSISDAEAEVAMAKQQGREMVNEARAYRERVLSDLDRRTKLARHQIEELAHGRDRLLQVFERARLVAVDVTSELQALDGPSELVNLAPTTGPLPLMVPQRPLSSVTDEPIGDATAALAVPDIYDAAEEPLVDDVTEPDVPDVDVDLSNIDGSGDEVDLAAADDTAVTEFPDTVNVVLAADADEHDEHDEHDDRGELPAEPVDASTPSDEVGDDDGFDSNEDDVVEAAAPRHDGNVVSLFRGREPELADDTEADIEGDTEASETSTAADRPDVGGIFERLRHAQEAVVDDVKSDGAEPALEAQDEDLEGDDELAQPSAFTRRDEALVPLIVGAARKLKRVLADEQNGV